VYDFLQLMYQDGYLSSTELTALRKTCRDLKENSVRVLRSLNIVSQLEIQGLLQRFYGHAAATQELVDNMDESLRLLIPVDVALHYSVVSLGEHDGSLHVLMEDPTDRRTLESLAFFLGKKVKPVVATASQLARAMARVYGVDLADMRLTTVLEASRGVDGGVVYDASQVAAYSRSEELLLDKGHSMGTLTAALAGGVGQERLAGGVSSREAYRSSHVKTLSPVDGAPSGFGNAPPEQVAALARRLSEDAFSSDPRGENPLNEGMARAAPRAASREPAKSVKPPEKSVFDDFAGFEDVEELDSSLDQNVEALAGDDEDLLGAIADLESDIDVSNDVSNDGEEIEIASEGELSVFAESEDDNLRLEVASDGAVDDAVNEDEIPEDFDGSFADDLLNDEALGAPVEKHGATVAPTADLESDPEPALTPPPRASTPPADSIAKLAPKPVIASAPAGLAPLVSRLLVKLALTRRQEDALARFAEILGPAGYEAGAHADGGIFVQAPGEELCVLAHEDDLAHVPAGLVPLQAALKQIFRLGRAA